MAAAAALRAGFGRALQHAGADTLARHFEQSEMRNAPDLDSGTVLSQAIAELALHRAVIALLVHVDEVDDDQTGEIAKPQLPRYFLGGLEISLECGILDMVLAGRAAGVDVDRNQRLGLVDHDVATGPQLHGRREHRVELALDAHAREQRLAVAILPDRAHIRRHQHFHEVARFLITGFAGDQNLVDFLVVEIAQRSLDQRAFLVDEGRRLRLQGHVAHGFPHADQILEVALDLWFGARSACGAQNDTHALGHIEVLHNFLQPRAILRRGDFAADAAATRGIGHQDSVASGERQVRRQRGALVAALFLDDLHQHHLAALDDFLDLVLTARAEGALGHFFQHVVAADGFDDFFFGLVAFVFIVVAFAAIRRGVLFGGVFGMLPATVFSVRRVVGMGCVFACFFLVVSLVMSILVVSFRADGSLRRGSVCLDGSHIGCGHRLRHLTRMKMAVPAIGMLVRMLLIVVIMMPGIIMVKFGVMAVGVIVLSVLVDIARLHGRRRLEARVLDDVALDALAVAAAA
ncbi:hypothetical protein GALL_421230 [mine drainage metagenome]|uniref:Uncharacterized protein n=1 Tax=mine drainage metagenome TaxID=410659 RepID=A0A1J5PXJ1_9ZZZZ